jgi:hypothetical protein
MNIDEIKEWSLIFLRFNALYFGFAHFLYNKFFAVVTGQGLFHLG